VVIDTDPALMVRGGLDVDDDLAILFALGSPEIEIRGITVTYGNTSIGKAYRDACRLMELAGRPDIPILKGAGWISRDMNRETDASRFIVEQIRSSDRGPVIVTLGPLTNLAAALRSAPDIEERIRGHLVLGGRVTGGRFEFNFFAHPKAVDFVLATAIPRGVVPIDVCLQVTFTKRELERFRSDPDSAIFPLCRSMEDFLMKQRLLSSLLFFRKTLIAPDGFHPWDVVAMAYLIKPGIFSGMKRVRMWMNRARVMCLPSGSGTKGAEVTVPSAVDAVSLTELALERILAVRRTSRTGRFTSKRKLPPTVDM